MLEYEVWYMTSSPEKTDIQTATGYQQKFSLAAWTCSRWTLSRSTQNESLSWFALDLILLKCMSKFYKSDFSLWFTAKHRARSESSLLLTRQGLKASTLNITGSRKYSTRLIFNHSSSISLQSSIDTLTNLKVSMSRQRVLQIPELASVITTKPQKKQNVSLRALPKLFALSFLTWITGRPFEVERPNSEAATDWSTMWLHS